MTVRFRALIQFVGAIVLFGFLGIAEGEPRLILGGVVLGIVSAILTLGVWWVFRGWFTRRGWRF